MNEFTENFAKVSGVQSESTETVAANTEELRASFDNINNYVDKQVSGLSKVYDKLNSFILFMETLNQEINSISSDSRIFTERIKKE